MSWWNLLAFPTGKGQEFDASLLVCSFCDSKGHFNLAFRLPCLARSSLRGMFFDVWKCANCGNGMFVMWSGTGVVYGHRAFPPAKPQPRAEPCWPEEVGRSYVQAEKALESESWDAAATMARRAVQAATRQLGAKPGNLRDEIDDLAEKGVLPDVLAEWAHEVRELGNVGAHPGPRDAPVSPEDAQDVVKFTVAFLLYAYTLPDQVKQYRERRQKQQ